MRARAWGSIGEAEGLVWMHSYPLRPGNAHGGRGGALPRLSTAPIYSLSPSVRPPDCLTGPIPGAGALPAYLPATIAMRFYFRCDFVLIERRGER